MAPAPGHGILEFEDQGGRTVTRTAYATSPLRFLTPRNRGEAAWVYSSSHGGGLVDGDALDIEVKVGPKAQALLLSQSATKAYRSPRGSSLRLSAQVGENATLCSVPDPIICFEGAGFRQEQEFRLADTASLLLVDTLSGGRHESGERWLFREFQSRIRICRGERLVFLESLRLDAQAGALADRLGRFNALSLLLLTGPRFHDAGKALLESVPPLRAQADFVATANPLAAEGVLLRMAAVSTEELFKALRQYLHFLPSLLGDDPWARKW